MTLRFRISLILDPETARHCDSYVPCWKVFMGPSFSREKVKRGKEGRKRGKKGREGKRGGKRGEKGGKKKGREIERGGRGKRKGGERERGEKRGKDEAKVK